MIPDIDNLATAEEIERFVQAFFADHKLLAADMAHDDAHPDKARRFSERNRALEDESGRNAGEALDDLLRAKPVRAWPILLRLVDEAPDMEALAFIAAGPLEDLIAHHGDTMVETIAEQAGHDPRLSEALGMVWGWESLDPSVRDPLIAAMPPDVRDVLRADMEIVDRHRAKNRLEAPLFAPDRDRLAGT